MNTGSIAENKKEVNETTFSPVVSFTSDRLAQIGLELGCISEALDLLSYVFSEEYRNACGEPDDTAIHGALLAHVAHLRHLCCYVEELNADIFKIERRAIQEGAMT